MLNWRAIGIGAAVGVGIGIVSLTFNLVTDLYQDPVLAHWLAWAMRLVGFAADVATGAVAGYLAASRGAIHGLLAGVLATLAGFAVGMVGTIVRYQHNVYADMPAEAWISIVAWALVGVLIATVSGLVAAPLGARHAAQRVKPA